MHVYDIKLFAKIKKKWRRWFKIFIRVYKLDIEREFCIGKCAMLITTSGKRETAEEIGLPNQESIGMLWEKENNKYLRLLEVDTVKQAET